MSRTPLLTAAAAIAASLLLASCTVSTEPASPEIEPIAAPHWSYDEHGGEDGWADLAAAFGTCAVGVEQSPIDLPAAVPEPSQVVELEAEITTATEAHSGHASQIGVDDDASMIRYDGSEYELLQMHAHSPAEHTVAGVAPAAELHLVHSGDDGELLVLGVLATLGEENPALQPFLDTATGDDGTTVQLDIASILPASVQHWSYEGSLTTPPCSESVHWLVLSTSISISAEQVATLTDVHEHNARSTRPLGDRVVDGGDIVLNASTD